MTADDRAHKNFIFDLDGTLIDSLPGIFTSLRSAHADTNVPLPFGVDQLRSALGPPLSVILRHLHPTLTDAESTRIEQAFRLHYDQTGWQNFAWFGGARETLRALILHGHSLFLMTNKPGTPTMKILASGGLSDLFGEVLTRDLRTDGRRTKREMLPALLERHGLAACCTTMVGDTEEDGEAASAGGLRFAFAAYGYGTVHTADRRLEQLSDLLLPRFAQEESEQR